MRIYAFRRQLAASVRSAGSGCAVDFRTSGNEFYALPAGIYKNADIMDVLKSYKSDAGWADFEFFTPCGFKK